jgi:hypothetical protein
VSCERTQSRSACYGHGAAGSRAGGAFRDLRNAARVFSTCDRSRCGPEGPGSASGEAAGRFRRFAGAAPGPTAGGYLFRRGRSRGSPTRRRAPGIHRPCFRTSPEAIRPAVVACGPRSTWWVRTREAAMQTRMTAVPDRLQDRFLLNEPAEAPTPQIRSTSARRCSKRRWTIPERPGPR